MGKLCVRSGSVRIAFVAAAALISALGVSPSAQSTDPSTLPLLSFEHVLYQGGFRLPGSAANGDTFSFGGRQLAFNPEGRTLFVGSRAGRVAEVSIPTPVNSSNPNALPFAGFVQGFFDPTEGRLSEVATDGIALDSLMVYGNRLYGSAVIYYDATNSQRVSHFSRSLQLGDASFQGWSAVWQADRTGFVSGAMSAVPPEWQPLLGGPAVTGQCCVPIVGRTSWGPAAFSFNPSQVGQSLVPATPLLYYDGAHPTLGTWDNSNPVYSASIQMGGMVIVPGTRSALYFGTIGTGPNCYGNGTGNPALVGTAGPDGEIYCYDPTNSDKGSHQYPYRYQIWAYDLNDLAAVKAATKHPWDVLPYGVWPFDLPTQSTQIRLGGVGYDATTRTLYVSQLAADQDGYSYRPVIHALLLNAGQAASDDPTGDAVSSVSLISDLPFPQNPGTSIRFRATPRNGAGPVKFKWMTFDGSSWTVQKPWSTDSEFTYVPASVSPSFRVGVQARNANSTDENGEASAVLDFPIGTNPTEPPPVVSSVTLTSNIPSPQQANTKVKWTATAVGGVSPQYRWLVYDGTTWTTAREWSSSNTFDWTPRVPHEWQRVSVWARSGGSTNIYEATAEVFFSVTRAHPHR